MINVSGFPLCSKRLQFQRAKLTEESMTIYWAAVAVAADLDDEKLTNFGGFDFNDMSDENGSKLLGRLEQFIRSGLAAKARSDQGGLSEAEVSVRAFLGANGVKVSRLKSLDDYWKAATTLWSDHIEASPKVRDIYTLRFQISKISKKQRSKKARANVSKLPAEWRAGGAR
ncbi:hypothetical protein [Rhizobium rhizogenes]|uniref:hypothetical protein n=1 Tax=Rhizobium rhizogenes TaxID=359 RepID=UPI0004D50350|nr:hypothetical protein [Rhizobium rhizogenes]KEA07155.1 hypothetical protein CN09_09435 [Rhizobium rhizogenes]NTI80408.1 hypothetical protein [Rhizobium rhizogenes]NTJ22594.1 hypothetical protein [Rhizobium rhizogenes]QUE81300.1 hypothetical protein EML492_05690 [Rhizobium rhizogenes]TQO80601.1 hypothetical protein FFE80_05730 [Rhizobium rhizogenes]